VPIENIIKRKLPAFVENFGAEYKKKGPIQETHSIVTQIIDGAAKLRVKPLGLL